MKTRIMTSFLCRYAKNNSILMHFILEVDGATNNINGGINKNDKNYRTAKCYFSCGVPFVELSPSSSSYSHQVRYQTPHFKLAGTATSSNFGGFKFKASIISTNSSFVLLSPSLGLNCFSSPMVVRFCSL